jgi:hypothetical protein
LRADDRLLASKYFWAIAEHRTASSLLPSMVMSARISTTASAAQDVWAVGTGGELRRGGSASWEKMPYLESCEFAD